MVYSFLVMGMKDLVLISRYSLYKVLLYRESAVYIYIYIVGSML